MASRIKWERDSKRQWSAWDETRDVFAWIFSPGPSFGYRAYACRCNTNRDDKQATFDTLGKAKRFCEYHTEGNWVKPFVIR